MAQFRTWSGRCATDARSPRIPRREPLDDDLFLRLLVAREEDLALRALAQLRPEPVPTADQGAVESHRAAFVASVRRERGLRSTVRVEPREILGCVRAGLAGGQVRSDEADEIPARAGAGLDEGVVAGLGAVVPQLEQRLLALVLAADMRPRLGTALRLCLFQGRPQVPDGQLLVVTEHGMGKRTMLKHYSAHGRGTGGQRILNITKKTGRVASVQVVHGDEELMMISSSGIVIRTELATINKLGPYAQGVIVMNLKENDRVACIAVITQNGNGEDDLVAAAPSKNGKNGVS